MSDLISRSALIKHLTNWRLQECPIGVCEEETETYKTICECIEAVKEQPTAYNADAVQLKKASTTANTNGDRIREMSDDELDEFLGKAIFCGGLIERECSSSMCRGCKLPFCQNIKNWLKEKVPDNSSTLNIQERSE